MEHATTIEKVKNSTIHTISILVSNTPGVLVRIALVFSRRGFNIESLVVSPALNGRFARMTITAIGEPKVLEQIIKQVNKLVDVLHASEHPPENAIEIELSLIKVKVNNTTRSEVLQITDHFKCDTIDFTEKSLIIRATGKTDKLDALIAMLSKYEILEIIRTGKILMARGSEKT